MNERAHHCYSDNIFYRIIPEASQLGVKLARGYLVVKNHVVISPYLTRIMRKIGREIEGWKTRIDTARHK